MPAGREGGPRLPSGAGSFGEVLENLEARAEEEESGPPAGDQQQVAAGGEREILDPLPDVEPGDLEGERVATGRHCFGCTAGHGSSCGGTIS